MNDIVKSIFSYIVEVYVLLFLTKGKYSKSVHQLY